MTTKIPSQPPVPLAIDQTLQQAIAYHQAGRLQEAGELYLTILQADPNHPEANHNMGVLAVQMKQPAAGLPYFMVALDADPARGQYWLNYIDALFQAGQLEDARQVLALAQQQGLQGSEVDALAARLKGSEQVVAQPNVISEHTLKESLPVSAAVTQKSEKHPKAKPSKPVKSAKRPAPHHGKSPDHQEINKLETLFNQGRYTEAANLAQTMTVRFPLHWIGWKMLGVVFEQMGRSADALEPMQQAAALLPYDAEAHDNLGITLQSLGRLAEAEASYRRALQIRPDYAQAHSNLGATLQRMDRLDEAEASYRRALQINPDYAKAHSNLGAIFHDLGRLEEAEASLRRALQINPDNAEAHYNLGITFKALGRPGEAEVSLRQALQINPDNADAHYNLGLVLDNLGRLDEAESCYRRALQINPDNADAHYKLGVLLLIQHRLGEAEASLQRVLQVNPDNADALNNLGVTLYSMGQLDKAESCYRRALQIVPDYAEAHNNLGITIHLLGRLDEAEASCRRALQINPGFTSAYSNLGNILKDLGHLDEALANYRQALQICPDYAQAHNNLLFTLNYHPDLSAEEIYRAYQEYDAQLCNPLQSTWQAHNNDKNPSRRLRIGYVSPDFRQHSCSYFLEPLLAHHDKTQVEVFAYAELDKEDFITARYKSYVEHWIPTRGMSDETLVERIRNDGIDILVELAGHTAGNRLLVFARKPAPVSLCWMGYGYTTGLSAIDYYLTDEISAPIGSEGLFAEHPWRIATPPYAYRPAVGMGEVNNLPAQQRGYITFGTLSRSIRINHRTIRVWAELLKAIPDSRLVINSLNFKDAVMQERLAAHFAEHGIAPERLEIGHHSPPWDVLRSIDIGLDCFPHNSGTTLFETLYMGVPYITLAGRPSVGRLGSSILQGVGHPEWIAKTEDEYVEKAVALAEDLPKLAALRAGLRQEMQAGPLMDEPAFARKMEAAYREMFGKWARG